MFNPSVRRFNDFWNRYSAMNQARIDYVEAKIRNIIVTTVLIDPRIIAALSEGAWFTFLDNLREWDIEDTCRLKHHIIEILSQRYNVDFFFSLNLEDRNEICEMVGMDRSLVAYGVNPNDTVPLAALFLHIARYHSRWLP